MANLWKSAKNAWSLLLSLQRFILIIITQPHRYTTPLSLTSISPPSTDLTQCLSHLTFSLHSSLPAGQHFCQSCFCCGIQLTVIWLLIMSVQFCLALLALSSLTAASDPGCEELLKILEDRSKLHGKWIYYAGVSATEGINYLKSIQSSWIELSPIPDSDDMTLRYGDKMDGKCVYGSVNATFSGNSTAVTFYYNSTTHEHVGKHLVTCPDCILWTDNSVGSGETKRGRNIYIFTKSGTLDASQLEVFKKQAQCLDFPTDIHFGENKDLCPDEKEAATDVTKENQ
uniref:Apolipoprotein M n=1 Tax=Amphiprion ocellaris TaxID=80972 RepID=A0A3Q1AN77_AMPOC